MNQKIDLAEIANRLIGYAVPGGPLPPMRDFPRSKSGISICVANIDQYYSDVRELFAADRDVMGTYTIKTFESRVMDFIAPFVLSANAAEKTDVQAFIHSLKTPSLQAHDVYRPIYGVEIEDGVGPVELGVFTIYHTHRHAAELDAVMNGRRESALVDSTEHYLIRTRVQAREDLKARELGDELFEQFEYAIRCMLGPGSSYKVSVSYSLEPADSRSIVLNSHRGSSEVGRTPRIPTFMINDPHFLNSEFGFDRLWQHLGAMGNNELMKKVLLAVDWIGQSIAEKVPSSAFIKAAIALEVLFSPKKEFISSSITAQISESAAMLLGDNVESRFQTEKEVKDLYGIRSKVAHEGKTDVAYTDLAAVQNLAREVVIKMLTLESLKSLATGQDLQQFLKSQKYGCPPLT